MPRIMKQTYYLLWNSDAWGVYDKSACPDPGAFPNHCYKKYDKVYHLRQNIC